MGTTCKNCSVYFKGNFCNNCGQPAVTDKLNLGYILQDLENGLLSFDNGILYSIKELYTRPGHSIREFIQGKRVNHYKPLSLTILSATVFGLLYHILNINLLEYGTGNPSKNTWIDTTYINELIGGHYAIITLLSIPVFSMSSYVVFKRQGYNYIEHLVLNSFVASQKLLVHIPLLPLMYLLNGTKDIKILSQCMTVLDFVLLYWCFSQFFHTLSKLRSFLLSLACTLISFVVLILLIIIIVLAFNLPHIS